LDSKKQMVFLGVLGSDPVEVSTEVWQSGEESLPPELHDVAKSKISIALSALRGEGRTVEEVSEIIKTKGNVLVFASSPPICWNPRETILRKI